VATTQSYTLSNEFTTVFRRQQDDLPEHVKVNVYFDDQGLGHPNTGYYLDTTKKTHTPNRIYQSQWHLSLGQTPLETRQVANQTTRNIQQIRRQLVDHIRPTASQPHLLQTRGQHPSYYHNSYHSTSTASYLPQHPRSSSCNGRTTGRN